MLKLSTILFPGTYLLLLFSMKATSAMYCQATTGHIVELNGNQTISSGNIGETVLFPLSSLSSTLFPYYVDNFYQSPVGYESHASSTNLSPGSQAGWRKINDFLDVRMLYNNIYTIPYGWKHTGNKVKCNDFPQNSLQSFAMIIQKTSVTIRVTKTLTGESIEIPRTILYRQHWGISDSLSEVISPTFQNYLYKLVLSHAQIEFPATCTVKSISMNIDFGQVGMNEVNLKKIVKNLSFSCNRDSKLALKIQSISLPNIVSGNGFFTFGTTMNNLDVDAKFGTMSADSTGRLSPPILLQKDIIVTIPVTFDLKQRGILPAGTFSADGYIVILHE